MTLLGDIAKRVFLYVHHYTELDFGIFLRFIMFSLPNTYKNQYHERKLLSKNLLLFLLKHQVLPHIKVEQFYYLDCLLNVFLKLDVQFRYNKSRLKSNLMYYKNMKGLFILKRMQKKGEYLRGTSLILLQVKHCK